MNIKVMSSSEASLPAYRMENFTFMTDKDLLNQMPPLSVYNGGDMRCIEFRDSISNLTMFRIP